MTRLFLFVSAIMIAINCTLKAQVTVRTVRENLFIPWEILYGPDDKIWFTQKNGYICRLNPADGALDTLYRETAVVIRGEGGMTGMVLHPSFATQPYVFVAYNYLDGNTYKIKVVRYTYNGSNALASPLTIFDNIAGSQNHNGTRMIINGDKLFIATGDAEVPSLAQNMASPNGKILRINLDGSVPADNPVAGNAAWSWGHRNAQGLALVNGVLFSSEHGPSTDDEVNVIKKGRNYGWPAVTGYCNTPAEITFCTDSNVATPVIAWTPTIAVCGMDYYAHSMFPAWSGSLLMTTLKDNHLYQLKLNAGGDSVIMATAIPEVNVGRLRDICISHSGKVYISTSNSTSSGNGTMVDKIIELSGPAAGISAVNDASISIYPNPAVSMIYVKMMKPVRGTYQLMSVTGQVMKAGTIAGTALALDIQDVADGLYQLIINEENGMRKIKSVIISK